MAERIAFLVDRLNMSPFHKGYTTMSELDCKSSLDILDILCEIVSTVDPDMEGILKDTPEGRVNTLIQFLTDMRYNSKFDERQQAEFKESLLAGEKEVLFAVMFWSLSKFEHLQKRAYLAKFLKPIDIPPEFQGEDLIVELTQNLREMQGDFKETHMAVDEMRRTVGSRPAEMKAEIKQLEQEYVSIDMMIMIYC